MIPQLVIFTLALFGACAFVLGKPKWGLILCGPAIWHHVLSPIGLAVLGMLPLWAAIPVAIVVGIRLSFGMLTQALSFMFGRRIAEHAAGHAIGHYLQKFLGWTVGIIVAIVTWPLRAVWNLARRP
jgi:small-conductance mechanosensitive channel